jgi:hypothetical protein
MRVRANRELTYMGRMLKVGDEFDATAVDARFLVGDQSVEEVEDAPRRGRPPRQAEPEASGLEDMRREDLLQLAQDRGISLPPGYVAKQDLIDYIEGRQAYVDSDQEDDGA